MRLARWAESQDISPEGYRNNSMASPVSDECRACIERLRSVVVNLSNSAKPQRLSKNQVNDELERFSLWVGNIGALHPPDSPLSIESRLREAEDVLSHILELLDNLNEVTHECESTLNLHGSPTES